MVQHKLSVQHKFISWYGFTFVRIIAHSFEDSKSMINGLGEGGEQAFYFMAWASDGIRKYRYIVWAVSKLVPS